MWTTVKPVNKDTGYGVYRTEKCFLFGGFFIFSISEGLSECNLYLQDGLYWEAVFNKGLTVYIFYNIWNLRRLFTGNINTNIKFLSLLYQLSIWGHCQLSQTTFRNRLNIIIIILKMDYKYAWGIEFTYFFNSPW